MVPEFKCFIVDLPDFFIDFTPITLNVFIQERIQIAIGRILLNPMSNTSKSLVKVVTSTPGMLFGV